MEVGYESFGDISDAVRVRKEPGSAHRPVNESSSYPLGQWDLQTKLQTNCATQCGTERHKAGRSGEKCPIGRHGWLQHAQTSTRVLELENRCTGNRTVGSNPTLSANCSTTFQVLG
jgi:hypothetical protein